MVQKCIKWYSKPLYTSLLYNFGREMTEMVRNYKSAKIIYQQKIQDVKNQLIGYYDHVNQTNEKFKLWSHDELEKQSHGEPNEYSIIAEQYFDFRNQHFNGDDVIITRRTFRQIIMNTLQITGANTINSWIDKFIYEGSLSLNPTSSLSAKKHIYKPTPDTRYYVNGKFLHRERDTQLKL